MPVVTTFLAVDGLMEHLAVVDADGRACRGSVPSYSTLERAVSALSYAVRYGAWLARPPGAVPELDGIDLLPASAPSPPCAAPTTRNGHSPTANW